MNGSEKHYLERLLDPEDRDMIEGGAFFTGDDDVFLCDPRGADQAGSA